DFDKARKQSGKLRVLDNEVKKVLQKVLRDKRKAYVMTGHGEMNDPDSIPMLLQGRVPDRKSTIFKKLHGELNYEVKDLGPIDLATDVPDDATIVFLLGPTQPLQEAEWQ